MRKNMMAWLLAGMMVIGMGSSMTAASDSTITSELTYAGATAKEALASVLKEKIDRLGGIDFTMEDISHVSGCGIVVCTELDGDGDNELVTIEPYLDSYGFTSYLQEIWDYSDGAARCIFRDDPYHAGADGQGLYILKGEDGNLYVWYDHSDTMNGQYLGRIENDSFVQTSEVTYENSSYYDSDNECYNLAGSSYTEYAYLSLYCYNYNQLTDEYQNWKSELVTLYDDALQKLGIGTEQGSKLPNDGKFYTVKRVIKDKDGEIFVYTYEYDVEGREIREYCNSKLYEEHIYNDAGVLVHHTGWRKDGVIEEEQIYDDAGNMLESTTYTTEGKQNWHFVYTYDEDGKLLTVYNELSGRKEYNYDENGHRISGRTVGDDGSVWNTFDFELDEEGREIAQYLNKDGYHLKVQTTEYNADGSRTETTYLNTYEDYDTDETVYLEGAEYVSSVIRYDAEDRVLHTEDYGWTNYDDRAWGLGSTVDKEYNAEGELIRVVTRHYNEGTVLSYETVETTEWTAQSTMQRKVSYNHNYGYWTNLGEEEREFTFTKWEGDRDPDGNLMHAIQYGCSDPFAAEPEVTISYEYAYEYENAAGDHIGNTEDYIPVAGNQAG